MAMVPSLANVISSKWSKVGLVLALLGMGAATARTMGQIQDVPRILARHDSITVNLLDVEKEQLRTEKIQLCLHISTLRKTDWTTCLTGE